MVGSPIMIGLGTEKFHRIIEVVGERGRRAFSRGFSRSASVVPIKGYLLDGFAMMDARVAWMPMY